ncbi:WD domain G-beta repeat protein [Trichostrongylus colubriformis]|uniref:WD domain G-beta repeat protein n=1 Tax=Trichostrongylus colubriformis TaxID=6319 RepID=A0AAN8IGW9_TRICO
MIKLFEYGSSLLSSCGDDKTVRIWKEITNPLYLECAPSIDDSHSRAVRCVEFSHCGRYLASAGFDSCVVIYSREEFVKCCAFSPTDEFLATCSRDKSVWFWQMDEDKDFQVSSLLQPHTQDVKFVAWHPSEELLGSCSYDYSIVFYKFDGEDWITQQKIPEVSHFQGRSWSRRR